MRGKTSAQSLPVTLERYAMIVRYVMFALIAPLFFLGQFRGDISDFYVITAMIFAHNFYVHAVLWARAYHLFHTRANFFLYLIQISLIIAITGGESSDAYVFYHMLIIGFTAYDRRFGSVLKVSFACLAAYMSVILIEAFRSGLSLPFGVIVIRLLSTLIVGWMIAALSERLRRAEITAVEQTGQIEASEATLRAILNSAGDPIVVFDENEFIVEANDRAVEYLGTGRGELIGQRLRVYLFDDGALPHKLADLRARGQAETQEIVLPRSGDERIVEMIARSFIREGARYFVVLLRDVTERKYMEETTRLVSARLEKLNSDLRQLDKHKADFMRAVSAGVRTPLSAVAGYVDMLLDGDLGEVNPDQSKALQTCRRGLKRVFRLIDQTIDAHASRFGAAAESTHTVLKQSEVDKSSES